MLNQPGIFKILGTGLGLVLLVGGYYWLGRQTLDLTHPERASELLRHYHYQRIETQGYDYYPFACKPHELYRVRFKAQNEQGKFVEGVVCGDLLVTGFRVKIY